MTTRSDAISFGSLDDIAPETLIAHMSDPRMAEHMPLLNGPWDQDDVARFMAAKKAYWQRDGLGHWAIFLMAPMSAGAGFRKKAMTGIMGWCCGLNVSGLAWRSRTRRLNLPDPIRVFRR